MERVPDCLQAIGPICCVPNLLKAIDRPNPEERAIHSQERSRANLQGACWMVIALTGFTFGAVFVKLLAQMGIDVFFASVARASIGFAVVIPIILARGGWSILRTRAPKLHLIRAMAGGGSMVVLYYAYILMPLAEVTVLMFSAPLFTTILAALILKEKVEPQRWVAIAVGFIGVLLVFRPGLGVFRWEALLPLLSAFGFAVAVTVVKLLPREEGRLPVLFYFFLATLIISLPLADWTWPGNANQWSLLLIMGLVTVAAQSMIIKAFQIGEASFVSLFDYSKLLLAVLLGYLFFSEVPDLWAMTGAVVIIGSTLAVARFEKNKARARAN